MFSPEAGLPRHLGEDGEGVLADLAVLLLAADLEDLLQLLLLVLGGGDDDGSVQQVQRHPVGRGVVRAPDLRDAPERTKLFDGGVDDTAVCFGSGIVFTDPDPRFFSQTGFGIRIRIQATKNYFFQNKNRFLGEIFVFNPKST